MVVDHGLFGDCVGEHAEVEMVVGVVGVSGREGGEVEDCGGETDGDGEVGGVGDEAVEGLVEVDYLGGCGSVGRGEAVEVAG